MCILFCAVPDLRLLQKGEKKGSGPSFPSVFSVRVFHREKGKGKGRERGREVGVSEGKGETSSDPFSSSSSLFLLCSSEHSCTWMFLQQSNSFVR